MKRGALIAVGTCAVVSIVFAAAVQSTSQTLKKGSVVGIVNVGGLTIPDAQKKLRVWWESVKTKPIVLVAKNKSSRQTVTASQLGLTLDDIASISQIPSDGLIGQVVGDVDNKTYQVLLKPSTGTTANLNALKPILREILGEPSPAKVKFISGKPSLISEQPKYSVDGNLLSAELLKALYEDSDLQLPLVEEPKKITDEVLSTITDVVAEFKTNFSAGNRPRSSNIKLASSIIDGLVLLPGERFSFNGVVGERTIKAGFQEAGVYINGRHDTGIGGGICQVSTTLYNACLLSNLKIVSRTNHSLPVPYVPPGRDATVNFGFQDLVIENNMATPIALSNTYEPGILTFRVLGKKEPGLEVKITLGETKYWSTGTKREPDPSLSPGVTKVKDKGSRGRSLDSYRTVYKNGVKVSTEKLGKSYYAGAPTLVVYGPNKANPVPPSNGNTVIRP